MSLRSTNSEKVEFLQTANMLLQSQIADLKRQLQLVQAQVAIVDRGLGDLGDTNAQAVLDAHETEVWNEALEEAASLFHHMCGQEGSRMTCHTEDCPKCRILARKQGSK